MRVSVLGAGTMGHGIAQVSAMAGHEVWLRDVEPGPLEDGLAAVESNLDGAVERDLIDADERATTLDRVETTTDLTTAVGTADLVVEAVPEKMELKRAVFADVEEVAPDNCVLGTNTSSLSVTEIAGVLDRPGRAVGLHFFNPVHIMDIVEVVVAETTDEATVETALGFVDGLQKEAVEVRDTAGFASSRLGVALGAEAMRMVEQGVASPRDVDRSMELGYNHPMGPLATSDVVGLDVRLGVLEYLREQLGERFRPPQILRRKVRADKLGRKTGEGFYFWEEGERVGTSDHSPTKRNP
jgi:3-hydroxybutyryl-CoA dehydrogenase